MKEEVGTLKEKLEENYDVKIFTDNVELEALQQIESLLKLPVFSDKKIRIMPDAHSGAGCVIGFTGDLGDKVVPNVVGCDIGCAVRVINLGQIPNPNFPMFHRYIKENIPSGQIAREGKWGFKPLVNEEMEIYREAKELVKQLKCMRELKNSGYINASIGTLGGGED